MRIFAGESKHLGLSTTAIFGDLGGYVFKKLQRYGKQYYMTICYPLSAGNLLQDEWPWMTLSGYFMSKFLFGQHVLNQSVWMSKNNTTSAILLCSVHCTIS